MGLTTPMASPIQAERHLPVLVLGILRSIISAKSSSVAPSFEVHWSASFWKVNILSSFVIACQSESLQLDYFIIYYLRRRKFFFAAMIAIRLSTFEKWNAPININKHTNVFIVMYPTLTNEFQNQKFYYVQLAISISMRVKLFVNCIGCCIYTQTFNALFTKQQRMHANHRDSIEIETHAHTHSRALCYFLLD